MAATQARKVERIQVMVTPAERQQLEQVAQQARVSLSAAGRRAIVRALATGGIARGRPAQHGRQGP